MGFGFGQSMNIPGAPTGAMPTQQANPRQRIQQLEDEYARFPGAAPGGTGLTGLGKNDAQGYSDMLNRRTEYMQLARLMQDKPLMNMGYGGVAASPAMQDPATGRDNSDSFSATGDAGISGSTMERFRSQFKDPRAHQAALAGLRNASPFRLG